MNSLSNRKAPVKRQEDWESRGTDTSGTNVARGPAAQRVRLEARWWQYRLTQRRIYRRRQKMRLAASSWKYSCRPFDENRAIFIHIPKCAGVSVSRALFGNLAGGHKTLHYYCQMFEPSALLDYFKFTIVRNPWDRLVSAYFFLESGGMDSADRQWASAELSAYDDFDEFVRCWVNSENIWRGEHFYPQSYFLDSGPFPVELDFIGRFETLDRDFSYIAKHLELDVALDCHNKSRRTSYADYFSPATRDIVASVYAEDIRRFGYDF